jgi:hypothetical protein
MKTNFLKLSVLTLILSSFFMISCEKEELSEEKIQEKPTASEIKDSGPPQGLDLTYYYKNESHTAKQWEDKSKDLNSELFKNKKKGEGFSYVGIDGVAYVFDNRTEAKNFENGKYQNMIKEKLNGKENTVSTSAKPVEDYYLSSRVTFCTDTWWSGRYYVYTDTRTIGVKYTLFGYVSTNYKISINLPSDFKNVISSYEYTYLNGGWYKYSGTSSYAPISYIRANLQMFNNAYDAPDGTWTLSSPFIDKYPNIAASSTYFRDEDLTNDCMFWLCAGGAKWNDEIEAFTIWYI